MTLIHKSLFHKFLLLRTVGYYVTMSCNALSMIDASHQKCLGLQDLNLETFNRGGYRSEDESTVYFLHTRLHNLGANGPVFA